MKTKPMTAESKAEQDYRMAMAIIKGAKREAVALNNGVSVRTVERRVAPKVREYRERIGAKELQSE